MPSTPSTPTLDTLARTVALNPGPQLESLKTKSTEASRRPA